MFRPNYLGCLLLSVSLLSVHGMRRRHVMSTSFIVPQTHYRREVSYRLWQSIPQPSIPESHTKVPHASYFAIPCSTPQSVPWFPALLCALLLLVAPGPSQAGLLEDYGGSSSVANPTTVTPTASGGNKGSVQIDPTLRGSYYYPTAKKRYLPRILKASAALAALPQELSTADHPDEISSLVTAIEDAVLPLQLYQSSLTGQGLSLNNEYAGRMKRAALQYERGAKQLTQMAKSSPQSSGAMMALVEELTVSMNEYRTQGRLDDASIPPATVEEMRRMAMRNKVGPVQQP